MLADKEKYHFADFTRTNFRRIIRVLKQRGMSFVTLDEAAAAGPEVVIRHDVDFSMHAALKMAQIESDEEVRASYHVLLHSPMYNFFEDVIFKKVLEISKLGHEIGLHFDTHFYGIQDEFELTRWLNWEKKILEELLNQKLLSFSFHITDEITSQFKGAQYANMKNAYSKAFLNGYKYCSDSNGIWRFDRLEELINNPNIDRLYLLLHPELWQDSPMPPRQRVIRCVQGRAEYSMKWYDATLAASKRENIG